jgi:hypothetical protein
MIIEETWLLAFPYPINLLIYPLLLISKGIFSKEEEITVSKIVEEEY